MIERAQFERWIGQILRCVKREKLTNLNEFERRMVEYERSIVSNRVTRSKGNFFVRGKKKFTKCEH